MNLHEDSKLFKQAIRFTAQQMQLPDIYVEKDYWIVFALKVIFESDIKDDIVFKGGTSLSKCYNIIDRFSEDIDLVVFRREGETDNKLKTKLKKITKTVSKHLPEIKDYDLTHKRGMIRKTAHSYNKEFYEEYGQVRDVIVIEATWFGYYEPYTQKTINSFIGEELLKRNEHKIIEKYGLSSFELNVLEPTRTICEKIMSLVRFSYTDKPIIDLQNKIRHTYDLHKLLSKQEYFNFFTSNEFDKMLLKVANGDVTSFKNNNQWLVNHPSKALIFSELDSVWNELSEVYNNSFKKITYGEFPDDKDVLRSLQKIKHRIKTVNWDIKF